MLIMKSEGSYSFLSLPASSSQNTIIFDKHSKLQV